MPRRRLLTSFSKGELSPLLEGRPDLAAYFEGCATLENWWLLRQGGVTRRPGLRYIDQVKDHTRDAILIPFEANVEQAYMLEFGHLYVRIYRNKARLPVELVSPYSESQIRTIHFTQSVDVLVLWQEGVPQHKLTRIDDENWSLLPIHYDSPPTLEADTDISGDTVTLTPGDTEGIDIHFLASEDVFLAGDIGRTIVSGASRAIITSVVAADDVIATILDQFPNVDPIDPGDWVLRGSPQTTLDPNVKGPKGGLVTLVAGLAAFRDADIGKSIKILGGIVKISTVVAGGITITGRMVLDLVEATSANPPAVVAGAWTLEIPSWSALLGYPCTGEFHQGRLGQAGTFQQPTTFWLSAADDFDDYNVGLAADRAIEYTMATRGLNKIRWMADNVDMFIGTGGTEHKVSSGKQDEPIGGDVIPLVQRLATHGSAQIQPCVLDRRVVFPDRSLRQIYALSFDFEQDGYDAVEITGGAEHITESGIRLGPMALQRRLEPRFFFVREDGQLASLTFYIREKVVGFTRIVTNGSIEAVAVIPSALRQSDQIWVIVKRTINGETKRSVEMFEENAEELASRPWQSCQTDSAKVYDLASVGVMELTGLDHLEGMEVDIVTDNSFRGVGTVRAGRIQLLEMAHNNAEVGLHYDSVLRTMRPAFPNEMVEGFQRTWIKLWARLHKTIGGTVNGQPINYKPRTTVSV